MKYEILVIDNNSTNREIELMPSKFANVKFIFRNENDGFGAGCNYGFSFATGRYVCLVNPDIILNDNVLLNFFNYMNENADVICCSCLQIDNEGKLSNSYDNFPGLASEFRETFSIGQRKHLKSLLEKKEIAENKIFEVDYHIGAFLFLKREDYAVINGFDERFFLYSEDIDFGLRLRKLGKKVVCIPSEKVFHYYNCTVKSSKGKFIRTYHINRSKMIYMYKHFSPIKRNVARVMMIFGALLRLIYVPFNDVHTGEIINGYKRIVYGMRQYFKIYNLRKTRKLSLNNLDNSIE